jgi:hypothetical protein
MSYADRENTASHRVLEKAGFQKGRLLENHYKRAINFESGMRGDLQTFYLDRPGSFPVDNEDRLAVKTPHLPQIGKEDVESIRSMLQRDGVSRKNLAI